MKAVHGLSCNKSIYLCKPKIIKMSKELLTENEKAMIQQSLDLSISQISTSIVQSKPELKQQLKTVRIDYINLQNKVEQLETKK